MEQAKWSQAWSARKQHTNAASADAFATYGRSSPARSDLRPVAAVDGPPHARRLSRGGNRQEARSCGRRRFSVSAAKYATNLLTPAKGQTVIIDYVRVSKTGTLLENSYATNINVSFKGHRLPHEVKPCKANSVDQDSWHWTGNQRRTARPTNRRKVSLPIMHRSGLRACTELWNRTKVPVRPIILFDW